MTWKSIEQSFAPGPPTAEATLASERRSREPDDSRSPAAGSRLAAACCNRFAAGRALGHAAAGEVLGERVGGWFRYLFWAIGAFSLFAAALGIVDYTSRLAADVIKTSYKREANESKLYAGLVWGLVTIGIVVLLVGVDQPLVLLVISAVVGGFMMFLYSGLLILINRKSLPTPIRVRGVRLGALIWSIALFGTLSALTFRDQLTKLFGE